MEQDELQRRLSELEGELAALRDQLEAVLQEVERVREVEGGRSSERDQSMRATLRCPACNHRRILYAKWLQDRTDSGAVPLSLDKQGIFSPDPVAPFECHICTHCGLAEWHVRDVDSLVVDDDRFELIDADDPGAGPYR